MEETAIRPSRKEDEEEGDEDGAGGFFASLLSWTSSEKAWGDLWGIAGQEITNPYVRYKRLVVAMQRLNLQFHERWRNVTRPFEKGGLRSYWHKLVT